MPICEQLKTTFLQNLIALKFKIHKVMKTIIAMLCALGCLAHTSYASASTVNRLAYWQQAPSAPQDTIRIKIGADKQIIIMVDDREALQSLTKYDLNKMVREIAEEAETDAEPKARTIVISDDNGQDYRIRIETEYEDEEVIEEVEVDFEGEYEYEVEVDIDEEELEEEIEEDIEEALEDLSIDIGKKKNHERKRTVGSLDFDIGFNNFTGQESFVQGTGTDAVDYSVKNWGSWYVAIGKNYQTHVGGAFALKWGANVSWHNFKFENPDVLVRKSDEGTPFYDVTTANPEISTDKSKLTAAHVNLLFMPMLDFGYYREEVEVDGVLQSKRRYDDDKFRIGLGAYAGYRIDSYTKLKYEEDGDTEKDRTHSSFNLNDWRYGVRLQVGINGVDIFANYDMNELFKDNKGPELHAFSLGIQF